MKNNPSLTKPSPPELWGGMECTINRVGDTFFDQLEIAGHYQRKSDIDLIASLGIRKLRFPILWERHEPEKGVHKNWEFTDARLADLRARGIEPIAGLIHHGSGPAFTNMAADDFATGLAEHARRVAERYPWIEYYTPVNEPLTTARFSGLYGFWYPHHTSDHAFCTMLLNQLKATVLAMREIRKVNPRAKLIQTEDLAKTYSVPALQYQADFDNDRRWLSLDILSGRLNREHPLRDFFIRSGITEETLAFFEENVCIPSVLGFNYYVTSERFLDNRLEDYPQHLHGGNWLDQYVDTEAVRVNHGQPCGLRLLLTEAHERFGLPMAITECHLHCTSEDRMRWFMETWNTCAELREEGTNILAVTAWSLFGASGWNTLLTTSNGQYEPGVFDLRAPEPRPTVMAELIRSLANSGSYTHPLLSQKGWWHRNDRFHTRRDCSAHSNDSGQDHASVLILGDGGLAEFYVRECNARAICWGVADLPSDAFIENIKNVIRQTNAWAVIFIKSDSQSTEVDVIEHACAALNVKLMVVCPNGEQETIAHDNTLVVSGAELLWPGTVHSALIESEEPIHSRDTDAPPARLTYVPDLVRISLDLMIDNANGRYELAHGFNELMPRFEEALNSLKCALRASQPIQVSAA